MILFCELVVFFYFILYVVFIMCLIFFYMLIGLDLDNIYFNDEVVLGFFFLLVNINFNLLILVVCYLISLLVMLVWVVNLVNKEFV